ncbi:MAG: glycosyltransferase family 39 protein [Chloroflexota bacterium]|nr:glycosyltransferase family 39 protein [Chloroflexota bacterium]
MSGKQQKLATWFARLAPLGAVLIYLALTLPQLHLPGLHYDEAKEAGVNAMEMLLRQNVHAFRSAGVQLGDLFLPLMVQDYIGALNVFLALPLLSIFGVTVTGLRLLSIGYGLITILLTWRLGNELSRLAGGAKPLAGGIAALLLALSPSFVFWSRQGIFVTNSVVTLAVALVLVALRWWQTGRVRYLCLLAVLAGLGLWTKLLFVWVLGALAVTAVFIWLISRWYTFPVQSKPSDRSSENQETRWWQWFVALGLFFLALSPLILFNLQTAGTLTSIFSNLGESYYGVENRNFLNNLTIRVRQLGTLLKGDHFWYLGGSFANQLAQWLAVLLLVSALLLTWWMRYRRALMVLLIVLLFNTLLVLQSNFTVSDLFVTHYAILQPFLLTAVALSADTILSVVARRRRLADKEGTETKTTQPDDREQQVAGDAHRIPPGAAQRLWSFVGFLVVASLLAWSFADIITDLRYHQALAQTGGHATHSDATNRLGAWLDENAVAQPLALDWGFDAPVRYLTENRVRPLELFSYERLDTPDAGFAARLAPFLEDSDRRYLFHTAEDTIFLERREALEQLASERGLRLMEEVIFRERSGRPIYIVGQLTQVE